MIHSMSERASQPVIWGWQEKKKQLHKHPSKAAAKTISDVCGYLSYQNCWYVHHPPVGRYIYSYRRGGEGRGGVGEESLWHHCLVNQAFLPARCLSRASGRIFAAKNGIFLLKPWSILWPPLLCLLLAKSFSAAEKTIYWSTKLLGMTKYFNNFNFLFMRLKNRFLKIAQPVGMFNVMLNSTRTITWILFQHKRFCLMSC